jgi:hypothetical protein
MCVVMSEVLHVLILCRFTLICQKAADNVLLGTTLALAFTRYYNVCNRKGKDRCGMWDALDP